jgi:hypothetical protein
MHCVHGRVTECCSSTVVTSNASARCVAYQPLDHILLLQRTLASSYPRHVCEVAQDQGLTGRSVPMACVCVRWLLLYTNRHILQQRLQSLGCMLAGSTVLDMMHCSALLC